MSLKHTTKIIFILSSFLGFTACTKSYEIKSVKELAEDERLLIGEISVLGLPSDAEKSGYLSGEILASYDEVSEADIKSDGGHSDIFTLANFTGNHSKFHVKAKSRTFYIKGVRFHFYDGFFDNYQTINMHSVVSASKNECEYIGSLQLSFVKEKTFSLRVTDKINAITSPDDCMLKKNIILSNN